MTIADTPKTKTEYSNSVTAVSDKSAQEPTFSQVVVNLPQQEKVEKSNIADIINALAALMWPIVILIILFYYKKQITSLISRLRSGKAFGAEAEFENELETLNREAKKAKEEADAVSVTKDNISENTDSLQDDEIRKLVLSETKRSPRLGMMLLGAEIEKLARRVAASTGHHNRSTLRDQIELWSSQLPPHVSIAFRLFSQVRNKIVHGAFASEQEILSAIDSGLTLYDALLGIPIESNIVIHPGVDIFSDPEATQPLPGKGVMMKTIHNGSETIRIFPSTLTHFKIGMKLTWEWNMSRVWGDAWYLDPKDGELKKAWSSSAEFVGRDLDQV